MFPHIVVVFIIALLNIGLLKVYVRNSDINDVEIKFIDKENLPLTCISVLGLPESEVEIRSVDLAETSEEE